jgi:hypothetical protein
MILPVASKIGQSERVRIFCEGLTHEWKSRNEMLIPLIAAETTLERIRVILMERSEHTGRSGS